MPASLNNSLPPARLASRDLPRGPDLWCPEQTLWTENNTDGLFYTQIIENFLRLTKGPRRGEQVRLRHWQADTICDIFRLNPETGRRQFRSGLFGVSRKNSKSLLGAGLGLAGMLDEQGAEVYCLDPATRVLFSDLTWRPVGEASEGDELVGFDEEAAVKGTYRKFRMATVESADRIVQPTYRITVGDGRTVIASGTHKWLARNYAVSNLTQWVETRQLKVGARIRDFGMPWDTDTSRDAGYLAGMYDGEGCVVGANTSTYRTGARIGFAQRLGPVWDATLAAMEDRGFTPKNLHAMSASPDVFNFDINGIHECCRLIGSLRPVRFIPKVPRWLDGMATNKVGNATVVAVEFLGDREVVAIGTSTKTLIAEGLFSHNSCAGDKDQARLVFKEAKEAVDADDELRSLFKVYKDALEIPKTGSVWRVLSSEAFTKEGLNPSLVIFDEVHVQPNDEMWNVMSLGSGTREQPLVLGITTAGVRTDSSGRDSLCYQMYQRGKRVLAGEEDDPTFFFRWYEPFDLVGCDHRERDVWEQANPAVGDFLYEADFESVIRSIPEPEFRTKRLNLWVSSAHAWLPHGAWGDCEAADRYQPDIAEMLANIR